MALKPELLRDLAALKGVSADDPEALRQAEQFSRTDWQAVSQQLQDRLDFHLGVACLCHAIH